MERKMISTLTFLFNLVMVVILMVLNVQHIVIAIGSVAAGLSFVLMLIDSKGGPPTRDKRRMGKR